MQKVVHVHVGSSPKGLGTSPMKDQNANHHADHEQQHSESVGDVQSNLTTCRYFFSWGQILTIGFTPPDIFLLLHFILTESSLGVMIYTVSTMCVLISSVGETSGVLFSFHCVFK